ncbi:MAG: hypothetical protein PUC50_06425 [Bacteroidales bacterium]|mgnify:CR=1 FL=1|nr:hypothetical protein [Bacteroidales bacterium]
MKDVEIDNESLAALLFDEPFLVALYDLFTGGAFSSSRYYSSLDTTDLEIL